MAAESKFASVGEGFAGRRSSHKSREGLPQASSTSIFLEMLSHQLRFDGVCGTIPTFTLEIVLHMITKIATIVWDDKKC
jgi:hypothetical protein